MCCIGVLDDAICLQVGHQERNSLQQLLFRELEDQTQVRPSHPVKARDVTILNIEPFGTSTVQYALVNGGFAFK